jgi:hypothetical protein
MVVPVSGGFGAVLTDRLDLRPFRSSDVDGLAPVFAKPQAWHFPHGRGFDRAETARFVERQQRASMHSGWPRSARCRSR